MCCVVGTLRRRNESFRLRSDAHAPFPQLTKPPKTTPPDGFADNEPSEEIVNDSLGTVDPADTTDTDPDDDPESTGTGPKGNEALIFRGASPFGSPSTATQANNNPVRRQRANRESDDEVFQPGVPGPS
jgi:hypothetical protein